MTTRSARVPPQARRRPIIGVTTYPADDGGRVGLPREYVDSVRRAGGRAVLIAPGDDDVAGLVASLDGVVLAGGGDLDPACFGGERHESVYQTDPERDEMELALVGAVMQAGLPTLAICRGLQVLNVALGGTLHVHLPDVIDGSVAHRAPPHEPIPHAVRVEEGALVARTVGATEFVSMSWHHQGVDRLGRGLRPVAHAADGVVEALELEGHPWLAAVQWHPELTAAEDPTQQRLFDALVEATRMTDPESGED